MTSASVWRSLGVPRWSHSPLAVAPVVTTGLAPVTGNILGAAGRTDSSDITVYKAMGLGMEDMVAANLAYEAAVAAGVGQRIVL